MVSLSTAPRATPPGPERPHTRRGRSSRLFAFPLRLRAELSQGDDDEAASIRASDLRSAFVALLGEPLAREVADDDGGTGARGPRREARGALP